MTATSVHPVAEAIVPTVRLIQGYYHNLLDGATPEMFAQRPEGVQTNHPAFVLGHVAYYSNKFLASLGGEAHAFTPDQEAVYQMKAECVDAPDGARYLPMDESVRLFDRVMGSVIETLPTIDGAVFDASPEGTSFDGLMTTMGGVANFVLVAHPMMHAGQLSAWRRCMGLGPSALR